VDSRLSGHDHVSATVHANLDVLTRDGAAMLPEHRAVCRRILRGVEILGDIWAVPGKRVPGYHDIPSPVHRHRSRNVIAMVWAVVALFPDQVAIARCILGGVVVGPSGRIVMTLIDLVIIG